MTIKEYYKDQLKKECYAKVVKIDEVGVYFDKTVAFPEGGGQIGDRGFLKNLKTGEEIEFSYTTKHGGRRLELDNFPKIFVEGEIVHHLEKSEFVKINLGDEYKIVIDEEIRAKATINHTGIHLVLMELEKLREGYSNRVCGAKISDKSARLDFKTTEKFTREELDRLTKLVNEKILDAEEISTISHKEEEEALYWECENYKIPCGGTHLTNTKFLGKVSLKRKNIGKGLDRIIAEFKEYELPEYRGIEE